MSKEAVFTMKLEPELRTEFMAAAQSTHRPASQVLRELMRQFIEQQRATQEYDDYFRQKVAASLTSAQSGLGRSNDEVEATFAAKRAKLSRA